MSGISLSDKLDVRRLKNAVAAGATDITDATVVDMANYDGVLFLIPYGTITDAGVQGIEIHGSNVQGSGYALLQDDQGSNCSVVVADNADNKVQVVEVTRPQCRYLKPVVKRATQNAVVDGIIAILINPRVIPVTFDTTAVGPARFISPGVAIN